MGTESSTIDKSNNNLVNNQQNNNDNLESSKIDKSINFNINNLVNKLQNNDYNFENMKYRLLQFKILREQQHDTICDHVGLPLCNKYSGSPKLENLSCYHIGCNFTTTNIDLLINHLKKYKQYKPFYHKYHSNIYYGSKNQVIKNDEKICKSCHKEFKSCDELCEHLARLGVNGFWKPGKTYYEEELELRKSKIKDLNIFHEKRCIICLDNNSEILYYPCMHHKICNDCYRKYNNLKCPYCKKDINSIYKLVLEI